MKSLVKLKVNISNIFNLAPLIGYALETISFWDFGPRPWTLDLFHFTNENSLLFIWVVQV
jgi:hypothetical protein